MNKEEVKRVYMSTDDGSMVKVEYLEQALRKSYGPGGFYSLEKALVGEKMGKWKILRREPSQEYGDKMMRPSGPAPWDLGEGTYATKGIKKKTVAWIQDSSIRGGAEISNELVIKVGVDCGFSILVITPKTVSLKSDLEKSDLAIFNNIWTFDHSQMKIIDEFISQGMKPYVKYEHDHRELSRSEFWPEFSRRLFANSILNVFLSPIHLENHRQVFGCDGICLPLAIDCVPFLNGQGEIKREPNFALVCNLRNFKTWFKLQTYVINHPDIQFDILAKDPVVVGNNVRAIPMVPYEGMPALYRSHEYVVHLLDGWGAGERVVFEGALSGCKVIADERVGHMSWKKDLTNISALTEWLTQAPYDFWKVIEGIL